MNTQSDTPETDSAEKDMSGAGITIHTKFVASDFARNLERERDARFTIEEIADYLAGWTLASFDEVAALGAKVTHNALNQLRDPQDGIAAVKERKKNIARE